MTNVYYVYIWSYKNEIVYIGKGKGARWSHGNSGTSTCYELNKIYFSEGNDNLSVEFYEKNLSNKEALDLEGFLIRTKRPRFNKEVKEEPHRSVKINKRHRMFKNELDKIKDSGRLSKKEYDRCLSINSQLFEVYKMQELSLPDFSFKGYCKLKGTRYNWLHRIIMNRAKEFGDGVHHEVLTELWKDIYSIDFKSIPAN